MPDPAPDRPAYDPQRACDVSFLFWAATLVVAAGFVGHCAGSALWRLDGWVSSTQRPSAVHQAALVGGVALGLALALARRFGGCRRWWPAAATGVALALAGTAGLLVGLWRLEHAPLEVLRSAGWRHAAIDFEHRVGSVSSNAAAGEWTRATGAGWTDLWFAVAELALPVLAFGCCPWRPTFSARTGRLLERVAIPLPERTHQALARALVARDLPATLRAFDMQPAETWRLLDLVLEYYRGDLADEAYLTLRGFPDWERRRLEPAETAALALRLGLPCPGREERVPAEGGIAGWCALAPFVSFLACGVLALGHSSDNPNFSTVLGAAAFGNLILGFVVLSRLPRLTAWDRRNDALGRLRERVPQAAGGPDSGWRYAEAAPRALWLAAMLRGASADTRTDGGFWRRDPVAEEFVFEGCVERWRIPRGCVLEAGAFPAGARGEHALVLLQVRMADGPRELALRFPNVRWSGGPPDLAAARELVAEVRAFSPPKLPPRDATVEVLVASLAPALGR